MARETNTFSAQMLVLVIIAITASSSTWVRHGSDQQPPVQQSVAREKGNVAPTAKSSEQKAPAPLPILRPLVQLAAAIGPEPLSCYELPGSRIYHQASAQRNPGRVRMESRRTHAV